MVMQIVFAPKSRFGRFSTPSGNSTNYYSDTFSSLFRRGQYSLQILRKESGNIEKCRRYIWSNMVWQNVFGPENFAKIVRKIFLWKICIYGWNQHVIKRVKNMFPPHVKFFRLFFRIFTVFGRF